MLFEPIYRFHSIALSLSLVFLIAGCSGNESVSQYRTGVFLDSPVEGLNYETESRSGKTDANGEFDFIAGKNITFSIGGFTLPAVQAANIVTPLTIFDTDDVNDPRVQDLARLLQSMDSDGNLDNGIQLSATVEVITSDTVLEFGSDNFDAQAQAVLLLINESQSTLLDRDTATAHLTQTLSDNGLINRGCSGDHPYVGTVAELSTEAHGVSGTVTILDDCTIEVSQFNYDGLGPSVYFYGGVDRNYIGVNGIPMGPQLNGQGWANDTILLTIPDGISLDDFNSLSVWCFDFKANFGDAYFGL